MVLEKVLLWKKKYKHIPSDFSAVVSLTFFFFYINTRHPPCVFYVPSKRMIKKNMKESRTIRRREQKIIRFFCEVGNMND